MLGVPLVVRSLSGWSSMPGFRFYGGACANGRPQVVSYLRVGCRVRACSFPLPFHLVGGGLCVLARPLYGTSSSVGFFFFREEETEQLDRIVYISMPEKDV